MNKSHPNPGVGETSLKTQQTTQLQGISPEN